MNPICFYHRRDFDGICSGAIVKHFVPDCELFGIDYGDLFPCDKVLMVPERLPNGPSKVIGQDPECPGFELVSSPSMRFQIKRTVYMVDFSLPYEDMKRLAEVSDLIWIDHHKSAIDEMKDVEIEGIRDSRFAGCELTWAWFWLRHSGDMPAKQTREGNSFVLTVENTLKCPEAVRLLGRYDVFDKDNPDWEEKILPFQYGMKAVPGAYDPDTVFWQIMIMGGPVWDGGPGAKQPFDCQPRINEGLVILQYQAQQNAKIAKDGAFEFTWPETYRRAPEGEEVGKYLFVDVTLRCIGLNHSTPDSQVFASVYDPAKHDLMVCFTQLASRKWRVSLYDDSGRHDCGAICKTFGGGGHKGAAGFVCNKLPWEQ